MAADGKSTDLKAEIAALRRMSVGELRRRYAELFGERTRAGNREYLFRRVAWRLQALAEGDLTERARRRARELTRDADLRRRAPRELALPAAEGELKTVTGEIAGGCDEQMLSPGTIGGARDGRLPMPGQTLTRPYKGQVYEVRVLTNGFEYDGRAYRSLSAVAHAITGSHWNGYRFFGLLAPKQTAEKGDR